MLIYAHFLYFMPIFRKIFQPWNSVLFSFLCHMREVMALWGHKNPCGQNFWSLNFFFFLSGKTKLQILPGKKSSWAHIIFIHKSYNEIVHKIVKQPKKQGKNEILNFLGSCISHFCFRETYQIYLTLFQIYLTSDFEQQ